MRLNALVLRSETVRDCNVEWLESFHLPVEPVERVRTIRVGPTDSGPKVFHAEILQMPHRIVQAVVFKVKPLTDADVRGVLVKVLVRELWSAILAKQAHVEVAIVRGALGFAMPGCRRPAPRKIVQTVPVDSIHLAF